MAQIFNEITKEAWGLLERKIITGFNKEEDGFLNCVSLFVKYYHTNREHIEDFKKDISWAFKKRFEYGLSHQEHFKEGLFLWEYGFIHDENNQYFYILKKNNGYKTKEISFKDIIPQPKEGFYIAKDKASIVDFKITTGEEANFVVDYIRKNYSRLFYKNSRLEQQRVKDKRSHKIPLIVVKDSKNLITDKSSLKEVVNLKFIKEGICLQSLILPSRLKKIFAKLSQYPCEFQVVKEKRYVTPEVFYGYF